MASSNIRLPPAPVGRNRVDDLQAAMAQPNVVPPRLQVTEHNTPSEEKFTRAGLVRSVNVVVKNTPFTLTLGLQNNRLLNGQSVDFHHFMLDLVLVYDHDDPSQEKQVDYIKVKPVEFRPTIDASAQSASIELKIKTLTSQHEDMFFKAKIVALDPRTGREFSPSLCAYSEAIKVISKPEQLKKRKVAKKRTLTDMLVETVTRIEKTQSEQAHMIERLLQQPRSLLFEAVGTTPSSSSRHHHHHQHHLSNNNNNSTGISREGPSSNELRTPTPTPTPTPASMPILATSPDCNFEVAFANFIASYQSLAPDERSGKIRRIIRSCTSRDTERLTELIDLFAAEGLQQGIGLELTGAASGCSCPACPHKAELRKIDEFYKEFLTSPAFGSDHTAFSLPISSSSVSAHLLS